MSAFLASGKHSITRWLVVASATLFSHSLLAAPAEALDDIYHSIIKSYYSVNGFYNFSANQADKNQRVLIEDLIQEIDDHIGSAGEALDGANAEAFETAESTWNRYAKVLKQNVKEVIDTGYPDLRLAGDMASSNIAFNDAMQNLYQAINTSTPASNLIQTSRDAAMTMALMMTKYSARSTSTVSQVYSGGDAEITIDALAQQFDAKITKLLELQKGKPEAAKLLDSAKTKWDFIRSSYINYNENRVNFIVNLYSKKIISDIEASLAI